MEKIKVDDKYEIVIDWDNKRFEAMRYGESWRNCIGDNLILSMAYRIQELEETNKNLVNENRNMVRGFR